MEQEQDVRRCPGCGNAVPTSNYLMHSAFCRSTSTSTASPESAARARHATAAVDVLDVEDDDDEDDDKSDVMVLSPPAAPTQSQPNRRRVPPRPRPGMAGAEQQQQQQGEFVDLTGPTTPQQAHAQAASSPAVVVVGESVPPAAAAATAGSGGRASSPQGQPKDDGVGAGAGRGGGDEEVEIQCGTCTFANPASCDVCQMCFAPLGGGRHGQQQGMVGRMQGLPEDDDDDDNPPPGQCWTCPMCTFAGNRRGQWVCRACEVGRPRRQDMLDAEGEDGYVMVGGPGGGGGRRPGRHGAAGLDVPMRMLEDIMSGAAIGAVGGAASSALGGGGGAQTRQQMLRGMMFGGVAGGLLGGLREMMLAQQHDAFDVDNASYEDLLNLFGPGHTPEKASVEAVSALPESKMSEADVARLRRNSGEGAGASKDCSICMEEFEAGDSVRSLPCLHRFHRDCVDRWLTQHNATCPVCKMPIIENNNR